jgi:hypothetical protein
MAHPYSKSRLSSAIDWGVSALAAASAGFLLVAMPETLFSGLVVKSGLPNVLDAAQPPLGATARIAAAAGAALFAFGFVLSLLRALDRSPAPAGTETGPEVSEGVEGSASHAQELPRLRKADAHPDAPARRPIQAGRELGEPVEPTRDELLLEAPIAQDEPVAARDPAPLPPFLVPQDEAAAESEPRPQPDPQPEAEARPSVEPDAEPEPEPEPEAAIDLSALMERFETGLTRKQQAIVRAAPEPGPVPASTEPAAAAEEPADRVGHRLRSAIAGLQKVSGQGR